MFSTAALCPDGLPSFQTSRFQRSAAEKRSKFLRRLIKFRQMDFEFAAWQFLYLFISPQKVYRNFQYRYSTKNQYARDDPAFLVLLSLCLTVSSVVFSLVLGLSFVAFCKLLLWVIFVDCIGFGMVVATALWFICNNYLLRVSNRQASLGATSEPVVEWAYCFDIHLNALVPGLSILHGFQLILLSLLMYGGFWACVIGNSLWILSFGYYVYITFLGYSTSSNHGLSNMLHSTQLMLYPMVPALFVYCLSLMFQWNFTGVMLSFYQLRVS